MILLILLRSLTVHSQNLRQCRSRFDTYLNFKGSLKELVKFDESSVSIYHNGNREFTVYASELEMLAEFFEHTDLKQQEEMLRLKGNRKFSKRQKDSVWIYIDDRKKLPKKRKGLPLQGCRVALDPGHFGVTMQDAEIEGKYLYFAKDSLNSPGDSIKLFESDLTFQTAQILKQMLEEQGASVMLTRDQRDHTSFNCTYQHWLHEHKDRVLDSLVRTGKLSNEKKSRYMRMDMKRFFWEFFRDLDLINRAKVINAFNPHAAAIIHYNVDEQNEPWKKCTEKDFTMTFVGGAFTADNFEKAETRIHFLRLLLTRQLDQSSRMAAQTVKDFSCLLSVQAARPEDAVYLKENSMNIGNGVYARNLMLCRLVNAPLVYGEALYQDNVKEATELMKKDLEKGGVRTNSRIIRSATSYFNALYSFLRTL